MLTIRMGPRPGSFRSSVDHSPYGEPSRIRTVLFWLTVELAKMKLFLRGYVMPLSGYRTHCAISLDSLESVQEDFHMPVAKQSIGANTQTLSRDEDGNISVIGDVH